MRDHLEYQIFSLHEMFENNLVSLDGIKLMLHPACCIFHIYNLSSFDKVYIVAVFWHWWSHLHQGGHLYVYLKKRVQEDCGYDLHHLLNKIIEILLQIGICPFILTSINLYLKYFYSLTNFNVGFTNWNLASNLSQNE